MKNKFLLLLLTILVSIAGCTNSGNVSDEATLINIYPEDDPAQDPEMISFVQDPVDMSVPQGWRQEDIDNRGELKARFVKHDGSRLLVFCFDADTTLNDIRNILYNSITSAMPNAVKNVGMYELDVPGVNPAFEMYKGTITMEEVDIAMDANIAWRLDDRLGGCKYGLFYAAASKSDSRNQYEFLAITRSLK